MSLGSTSPPYTATAARCGRSVRCGSGCGCGIGLLHWPMAATATVVILALLPNAPATRLRLLPKREQAVYVLELANHNNVQYSGPFTVGHQVVPVIYDTGSFDVLVFSTRCHGCDTEHAVYRESASKTFVPTTPAVVEWQKFGSGSVKSEKGYETIRLGSMNSPYAAEHLPFWQILENNIPVWDSNAGFVGVVGLSHRDVTPLEFSETQDKTLLSAMTIGSFAICLERHSHAAPGWLIADKTREPTAGHGAGQFLSVDVLGDVFWSTKMHGFMAPGVDTSLALCTPTCGAIIDSGTSFIAIPASGQTLAMRLRSMVREDCSNLDTLPVLRFWLGNVQIELPPRAYVMKVFDRCAAQFIIFDKTSQFGPVVVLGMPFLRYYYTIFDRVAKQFHFAQATPKCEPSMLVPTFLNATHPRGAPVFAGTGAFTRADFEPTEVDLSEARVPAWALDKSNTHMRL